MTSRTSSDLDAPLLEATRLPGLIEADLLSRGYPYRIMERLIRFAAENADVDRCTLTSLDQHVLRVEASHERGGPPNFVATGQWVP